jgi:uncharacterized RDD family membrane protein YckC
MNSVNPYAPPKAQVADYVAAPTADEATRSQRLGAAMLDGLISMIWTIPLWFALGMFEYIKHGQRGPMSLTIALTALNGLAFVLVNGYFLKKTGQSLGKKIVGIRIATLEGEVPALGRILGLRILPVWIAAMIPMIGALASTIDVLFIFRGDRRCVHDLIAGTKVIRA